MAIRLTDLLIETVFNEASNDDAILDTLIPNPATGKNIKVRSALSRTDHPAYNVAKDFIAGKMGDEQQAPATQQQTPPTEEEPATEEPATEEPTTDEPVVSDEEAILMSQGFDENGTAAMMDMKNSGQEISADLEKISSIDPGTWKKLSAERQQAINDEYTTKINDKRDNLRSQIDAYTENGTMAPPELVDEFNAYAAAADERELTGMTDEERASHYEDEGELGLAKRYQQGLDMIDIDQELAQDAGGFDAEETATGI